MKLATVNSEILYSTGRISAPFPVLEAHEIGHRIIVLYDAMAFPLGSASRNLFAYDLSGKQLWRAEDIGFGTTDDYINIISTSPLVVGNFAGFNCIIDIETGKVTEKLFTK